MFFATYNYLFYVHWRVLIVFSSEPGVLFRNCGEPIANLVFFLLTCFTGECLPQNQFHKLLRPCLSFARKMEDRI